MLHSAQHDSHPERVKGETADTEHEYEHRTLNIKHQSSKNAYRHPHHTAGIN